MPRTRLELAHLAKIIESSDDAIFSQDLDGVLLSWNPAAERLFGYTAAEAVGRSVHLLVPPGREPEEQDVLARIRAGQDVTHFETVRRRRDGRLVEIALTVSPIRDDTGRVIAASKTARDITERQRAALAMRRLAAIVDSSDDAIVSKDLDGIILSWNRSAERLFGYTAEEAVGQSIRMIIPPDLQAEEDDATSPRNAYYILEHAASAHKEIVMLKNSYHVITADLERAEVSAAMAAFAKAILEADRKDEAA